MGKKILIVGAGIFSLPLIRKAKELGHYVISTHPLQNQLGFLYSDKNYLCDANDLPRLLSIAQEEKIDGVATISEYAALPVAYIARELNLPGYDYQSAQILSNKYLLRELQTKVGIAQPEYGIAHTEEEARILCKKLSKPLMVKPINSCGSRGVFKAHSWEEIKSNLEQTNRENFKESGVIMEEYMEGIELGGGVMFKDSKVFVFGITRKFVDDRFIPYANVLPAGISDTQQAEVITVLNKIAAELKITNTYLNVNMIYTDKGPRILELGGRLAGNSSPEITQLTYGVDPYEYVINFSLSEPQNFSGKMSEKTFAACILGSNKDGKVQRIRIMEEVLPGYKEKMIKSFWKCSIGDTVSKMESTENIQGFMILEEESYVRMLQLIKKVRQQEWLQVE